MSDIEQAKEAAEKAKAKAELAAGMFQLYVNLFSINAKYSWNKIVHEQSQSSNPNADLNGCSKKGPRGHCEIHSTTA
jgi:hypothetical protein